MKWCEHCNDEFCRWETWVTHLSNVWKFCPICGTPRPKEKTLEEKFKARLEMNPSGDLALTWIVDQWTIKKLAEIAEEHFRVKT